MPWDKDILLFEALFACTLLALVILLEGPDIYKPDSSYLGDPSELIDGFMPELIVREMMDDGYWYKSIAGYL